MVFTWGGINCQELADKFGTPLYVYDTGVMKSRCRELREKFVESWDNTRIRYAGKAFLPRAKRGRTGLESFLSMKMLLQLAKDIIAHF